MPHKTRCFEDYLAALPEDQRKCLQTMRSAIKAAAPLAIEGISYGLPAFRLDGKPLVAIGATKGHCAFYPMSATTIQTLAADLSNYDTSKGTIRFPAENPLTVTLVRKIVKARLAEHAAAASSRATRNTSVKRDASQEIEPA